MIISLFFGSPIIFVELLKHKFDPNCYSKTALNSSLLYATEISHWQNNFWIFSVSQDDWTQDLRKKYLKITRSDRNSVYKFLNSKTRKKSGETS